MKELKETKMEKEKPMIDPYKLINSKSIAAHCRNIKHQFNTLEIGVLIHRCKHISIDKKIEFYNEILNHPELYPDEEVPCRCIEYGITALDLIKMEINILQFSLNLFNKPERNAVFTLEGYFGYSSYQGGKIWADDGIVFKTLKNVHDYVEEEIITNNYYVHRKYIIKKKYLNNDKFIALKYKKNDANSFELFDINDYSIQKPYNNSKRRIGECCIKIPTPFKEGDIVTDGKKVGVLHSLYSELKSDDSDMISYCFFYHKQRKRIDCDEFALYDELEYYTEELNGYERILKAISSCVTKKLIYYDLLLEAHDYYKAHETIKESDERFWDYRDEVLEIAGLPIEEIYYPPS